LKARATSAWTRKPSVLQKSVITDGYQIHWDLIISSVYLTGYVSVLLLTLYLVFP
jgi:hypothetical protein